MFLNKRNIDFDEVRIDLGMDRMREFLDKTNGARTVPQILIDGELVGGYSELTEADMDGVLDDLKRGPCPRSKHSGES